MQDTERKKSAMTKTLHESLIKKWHPDRNASFSIEDLTAGSKKKVWWLCAKGHTWEAAVYSRSAGAGCPYCAGNVVIPGENDLGTLYPQLAAQWHPAKNKAVRPDQIKAYSNRKVWWVCSLSHEWQASVSDRTNGTGCPYCAGQKVWKGFNDLETMRPDLAAQWDLGKNGKLTPDQVTSGSNRKVWWKCDLGHEWQAVISQRKTANCPYCSNKKVLKGYNDLATVNLTLAQEWHDLKNRPLDPCQLSSGSPKRVWWRCHKGHEWQASVVSRSQGTGCPFCSGRRAVVGENDLATLNHQLAQEWHPDKNGSLKPSQVKLYSNRKVWWRCVKGHEWLSTTGNRALGRGCPYCCGRKVRIGDNDLKTIYPVLAQEWHPTKNGALHSSDVTASSNQKVWWRCAGGHEWAATVAHRSAGTGCPYCSGQKVLAGFNDLATKNSRLAQEWHSVRNGTLTPDAVTSSTAQKVWWKCEIGHEWQATINSRSGGSNCPYCNQEGKTSFAEQAIFYYCNLLFDAHNQYRAAPRLEIDIYLPDIKTGIEHDGLYFHSSIPAQEREKRKNATLKRMGIRLIRVKEWESFSIDLQERVIYYCSTQKSYSELEEAIRQILQWISEWTGKNYTADINIQRDSISILRQYMGKPKENSLSGDQVLMNLWNEERNQAMKPSFFTRGSNKKVWWRCTKGHEWQALISSVAAGNRCPYCANRKVLAGYNDLKTMSPHLAREWHPFKNRDLSSTEVTAGSNKRVWWKCARGHEWRAVIAQRKKSGCPYCSGKKQWEMDLESEIRKHNAAGTKTNPQKNH